MTTCWLDLETASTVNLPTEGVYRYAPKARILLNSWAVDDGPVRTDDSLTPDFLKAFNAADRIGAHNAEFDRTVLEQNIPDVRFDRWFCTMAAARRHGLPGGLGKLCELLGVPQEESKIKEGRSLVLLFCKPTKDGKWNTKETHPAEWGRFVQYAGRDIDAMRAIHKRMPHWNDAYEQPIWLVDQKINARGFKVDLPFVDAAIALLDVEKKKVDAKTRKLTKNPDDEADTGITARQVAELIAHILAEHGVDLPDMKAETLERRIADPDLPDAVRELLSLRQQSAKTSTSKYATLRRCASDDGRLRGSMQYAGAMRTQRWAGSRFQPHNLPRPLFSKVEVDAGIRAVRAGVFDLVVPQALSQLLSSAVRGAVIAGEGKTLAMADYSNVEGRALAWLAGETDKLKAFAAFDAGEGPDLYKLAYSRAFAVPVEDITDKQRQVGKVMELMFGYGGGVGAFVTGAATYRLDLDSLVDTAWHFVPQDVKDETASFWAWAVREKRTYGLAELTFRTCDAIKRLWRHRNPHIVVFWSELESAVRSVLSGSAAIPVGHCAVDKVGNWLRIKLPSGRYLSYPGARLEGEVITYMGQNQYTRTWSRLTTYPGKIAENVTQAVCRDLLAEALVRAENAVMEPVLHVHDEIGAENTTVKALSQVMTTAPWAPGLPLAVAGWSSNRYGKEK